MEDLVLADTDAIIDFFNGIPPMADIVELLVKQERISIAVITVFELYAGVDQKKRLRDIDHLLASAVILPLEPSAARLAGGIYTELKSRGRLIGNQDILIAAIAKTYELPILTRNTKHFQEVKGIEFYRE